MARNQNRKTVSTRTLAAFRAHLTRATNALASTKDRAERKQLKARIAELTAAAQV